MPVSAVVISWRTSSADRPTLQIRTSSICPRKPYQPPGVDGIGMIGIAGPDLVVRRAKVITVGAGPDDPAIQEEGEGQTAKDQSDMVPSAVVDGRV